MMPDVTAATQSDWSVIQDFVYNSQACRCLLELRDRVAALERAKASQPAPEQPPTPAAGVESVRSFVNTIHANCCEQGDRFSFVACEEHVKARDSALTKAARERAIGECLHAVQHATVHMDSGGQTLFNACQAIRTLANKEQQ